MTNTAIIGWSMSTLRMWCEMAGIQWGHSARGNIILLPVGSATCGTMLDRVILVGFRPGDGLSPLIADVALDWYCQSIRPRRPVGMEDDVLYVPCPEIHRSLASLTGSNAASSTDPKTHSADDHD